MAWWPIAAISPRPPASAWSWRRARLPVSPALARTLSADEVLRLALAQATTNLLVFTLPPDQAPAWPPPGPSAGDRASRGGSGVVVLAADGQPMIPAQAASNISSAPRGSPLLSEQQAPAQPVPPSVWRDPWHFLAFGLGSGTLPKAPGPGVR